MVKNAFAYACGLATLNTTGGEEIEINKNRGHVSTIMRLLTNKDGFSYQNWIKLMRVKME